MPAKKLHHIAQVGMGLGGFAVLILIVVDLGISQLLFQFDIFSFQRFQFAEHDSSRAGQQACA